MVRRLTRRHSNDTLATEGIVVSPLRKSSIVRHSDNLHRHVPGSYGELLAIAFPLILSTSSITVMHVIDRIFLSWYSPSALAASLAAGATAFVCVSLFLGTASYVSTFVSQYDGAGRPERIGATVWQGVYFCLLAIVVMAALSLGADPLFRFVGHGHELQRQEAVYFRVMLLGGGAPILSAALSSFYSGRGRTWILAWVNLGGAALNAMLDYCWIFGKYGFPEWGILGAALATVLAEWTKVAVYFVLFLLPNNRRAYATSAAWRPDPDLFRRLLRYGVPSGVQFMVDILAFTLFVLFLGRIGQAELAASTVAFSINTLVFLPMIGMAMATSVLVGRHLGANRPDAAARTTSAAFRLATAFMATFSLILVLWPDVFLSAFAPRDSGASFEQIAAVGRNLLYFVAGYSLVDAANIVFSAALKGAGDTRYVVWMMLWMATIVLVAPVYIACVRLGQGVYTAWAIFMLYVVALALAYWLRYRAGHWRSMRVIEHIPAPGAALAEGPVVEA